jgi:hypothetical protein
MKIKSFSVAVLTTIIAGCASPNRVAQSNPQMAELQFYVASNKPRAENGEMKWSDYYSGLYERHVAAHTPTELIQVVNKMLWNAQRYEAGAISKDEFDFRQRDLRLEGNAVMQRQAAAAQAQQLAQQQAQTALALQLIQASQPKPLTMTPIPSPSLATSAAQAQITATAYWTGKQQQVQTVTYQYGWSCEYNYAGRTFWRTFVGTCPSSVQVQ